MTRYQRGRPMLAAWLGLLLLLPALAGCGRPTVHLSGKVIYQGQPLPGGELTFRPADPNLNTVSAPIGPDGQYEVTLPAGEVLIAVDNREWQPVTRTPAPGLPPGIKLPDQGGAAKPPAANPAAAPASGEAKPSGRYVRIPEKFYQAETSGLKYTVKKGEDKHDIELK